MTTQILAIHIPNQSLPLPPRACDGEWKICESLPVWAVLQVHSDQVENPQLTSDISFLAVWTNRSGGILTYIIAVAYISQVDTWPKLAHGIRNQFQNGGYFGSCFFSKVFLALDSRHNSTKSQQRFGKDFKMGDMKWLFHQNCLEFLDTLPKTHISPFTRLPTTIFEGLCYLWVQDAERQLRLHCRQGSFCWCKK